MAHRRIRLAISALLGGLLVMSAAAAQYDPVLQYQLRGDRAEGLKTIPVGGLDVELLSLRIDTAQSGSPGAPGVPRWSDTLRARFFLPESASVHLAVRQLRSRSTYYWLDYPQPADKPLPWKVGLVNKYEWATQTVLQRLENVRLDDLGAVLRVGRLGPALRERVLPVDLSDGPPVVSADRYRFSLKTNGRANVTADVYLKDRKLYTRPANWEQAGSPITVLWDSRSCQGGICPEGWYRLVL